MKLVKYKLFFSWQFEEKEKWLNGMSEKGWQIERLGEFKHTFTQSEPGEYIYRMQIFDDKVDLRDYIHFVQQTGAELVYRDIHTLGFRKKASDGELLLDFNAVIRKKQLRKVLVSEGISCFSSLFLIYMAFFAGIYSNITMKYVMGAISVYLGVYGMTGFIMALKSYLRLHKPGYQKDIYE